MAKSSSSKGFCRLCDTELLKSGIARHIRSRHSLTEAAAAEIRTEDCALLKIEGVEPWDRDLWMYADVPLTGTLNTVDRFLRRVWMGSDHGSDFCLNGEEVDMDTSIRSLAKGTKLLYSFDYGDTTRCRVTFVNFTCRPRQGNAVRLIARNPASTPPCEKCGAPAVHIAGYQGFYPGSTYCEDCARKVREELKKDGEEDCFLLMPIVNSPRIGYVWEGELEPDTYTPPETAGSAE